jgi:hypothetical protein
MEPGNNLCFTSKRINYSISNETVFKVKNPTTTIYYRVPCILLPYIKELQENLNTMDIKAALSKTLQDNNLIIQKPVKNVRRYIYPQASFIQPINSVTYFKETFILNLSNSTENNKAVQTAQAYINQTTTNPNNSYFYYDKTMFTAVTTDAAWISVIQDNNTSFVQTIDKIKDTYFGKNVLLYNNQLYGKNINNNVYDPSNTTLLPYVLYTPVRTICNFVTRKNMFLQFGLIIVDEKYTYNEYGNRSTIRFLFIPFVVNSLISFYIPYRTNVDTTADQPITFRIVPSFVPYITDYTNKLIQKTFTT